jgi:hypothetical protein
MNRRGLLAGLLVLPVPYVAVGMMRLSAPTTAQSQPKGPRGTDGRPTIIAVSQTGPVTSNTDGQIIENLDIDAPVGAALTLLHRGVTVRNCRIRHGAGHGIHAADSTDLVLQDLEIDRTVGAASDDSRAQQYNNIHLDGCPNTVITRVKASRGSSNIYAENSPGTCISFVELHDARGPFPRGQNVQFNRSPNSVLQDFSAENGPTSWTEDNISVYRSDACVVRRGLVSYNNSPTGDGVMIEGAFNCLIADVDAVQQGNGAFAAVPEAQAGSGGCVFLRCRTRQSYNTRRDGRAPPTSNGLSFYMRVSKGAPKHTIADCHYDGLANPNNLIWDSRAVNDGWSLTHSPFAPRLPIRLELDW